ncbi:hypothetical protein [Chlamydiifrater phoenicopteri]|uniref:hypothetical protein n=1 Tax=Chlamydiifrater phoenicopteri TaxID=2681469 RepID=UPI001BCDE0FB|nr:hypothetical protein [Chlamydiifrater phoenicopteri]
MISGGVFRPLCIDQTDFCREATLEESESYYVRARNLFFVGVVFSFISLSLQLIGAASWSVGVLVAGVVAFVVFGLAYLYSFWLILGREWSVARLGSSLVEVGYAEFNLGWKRELAIAVSKGFLSSRLAVFSPRGELRLGTTLRNIVDTATPASTLNKLLGACIPFPYLIHVLSGQWASMAEGEILALNQKDPHGAEKLLEYLCHEGITTPSLLKVALNCNPFHLDSLLFRYVEFGALVPKGNGFYYSKESLPVRKKWSLFLEVLQKEDYIFSSKDPFAYCWNASFISKFLRLYGEFVLNNLEKEESTEDIDREVRIREKHSRRLCLEEGVSRVERKYRDASPCVHFVQRLMGRSFKEGEGVYASCQKKLEESCLLLEVFRKRLLFSHYNESPLEGPCWEVEQLIHLLGEPILNPSSFNKFVRGISLDKFLMLAINISRLVRIFESRSEEPNKKVDQGSPGELSLKGSEVVLRDGDSIILIKSLNILSAILSHKFLVEKERRFCSDVCSVKEYLAVTKHLANCQASEFAIDLLVRLSGFPWSLWRSVFEDYENMTLDEGVVRYVKKKIL